MAKMVERICQYCGKTFDFPEYRIAYGMGKYCSHKCADTANRKERVQRVELTCKRCGKTFYELPSQLKRENGAGQYCSLECAHPPLIKKCLNCGKDFRTSPAKDNDYCSQKCAWSSDNRNSKIGAKQSALHNKPEFRIKFLEWIRERTASEHWRNSAHFQKGEKHPAYKGNARERESAMGQYEYKKWRKDVFMRDFYTCQDCGKKGIYIHAHHIKEWAKFPELRYDVNNGITLCETCHKKRHKK